MSSGVMGFVLKKMVSLILMPSGLVAVLLFLGLFIWPLKRRRTLACGFFFMGFLLYCLGGSSPVANFLVWGLEDSARSQTQESSVNQTVTTIVLIAGGVSYDTALPVVDRLTPPTRLRTLKALELLREHPEIEHLLIIGGCARPTGACAVSEAETISLWIKELGLPASVTMALEERSRDTVENMENLKEIVGGEPFYLVTSAVHIPRVMRIARDLDLRAYPVPCNFVGATIHWTLWDLWPTPGNLSKTDLAFHEYLGIFWYSLKNYVHLARHKI
jgi:uncharacterized SAM-binding protein YcdF (DUF218 family)